MQQIMTDKVGVFRTGEVLKEAVDELTQLLSAVATSGCVIPRREPIPSS